MWHVAGLSNMVSKIKEAYRQSYTKRLMEALFGNRDLGRLSASWLARVSQKLSWSWGSLGFVLLAVGLLLYQTVLPVWLTDYHLWFVCLLLALLFLDRRQLRNYRALEYLLGYLVVAVIGLVFASLRAGQSFQLTLNGLYLVVIFPSFFLVASTFDKSRQRWLIGGLLGLAFPLLVAGLVQYFWGEMTPAYWVSTAENLVQKRAFGWSYNPNNLGVLALVTSLLSLFLAWSKKQKAWLGYSLLATLVLLLTFSRANWIAWLVAIAVVLLAHNWRYLGLAGFGVVALLVPVVRQRLLVIFSSNFIAESWQDGRLWALASTWDIFQRAPLLGSGVGSYGNDLARDMVSPVYQWLGQNGWVASFMVDMQWPQLLAQTGLVGLVAVGGFFVSYALNSWRSFRQRQPKVALASLALLLAMVVVGFLENVWFFAPSAGLWGLLLGVGIRYTSKDED